MGSVTGKLKVISYIIWGGGGLPVVSSNFQELLCYPRKGITFIFLQFKNGRKKQLSPYYVTSRNVNSSVN